MDERILETLEAIRANYGDGVFYNLTTVRNLMNDLAPSLRKERIQIANFLEIGGYFQLKYADKTYPVVRTRLTSQLMDTYAVDETAAIWVLNIFSILLGYNISDDGAVYKSEEAPPKPPMPAIERVNPRPFIGDERRPLMTVPRPQFKREENKLAFTNWNKARRISADYHSVAVLRNGQVKAAGPNSDGQCNTNTYDWRDIVAVSAGAYFTVGLRADGTVVGIGRNDFGQRDFTGWTDIRSVSAGTRHTVGLRTNGTLLACGQARNGGCKVSHWRNIVHAVAGQDCTFGIKKDGRVLVCGDNKNGDLQVSHLENVADIAYAAPGRILALLKDGTLARVGKENHMRKRFTHWKNIRQISAAPDYFAGLMEDSTVRLLAYFWQDSGVEAATSHWRDIVAIAAGRYHILGLKSDGKLLAEMLHPDISRNKGQINVASWEM
ncbi:MAG: hypothetical protein FWB91_08895 [Defluviitaleaceae bacterium]|nr:hypothetical protein [Defluviitaleaceae bacterium]